MRAGEEDRHGDWWGEGGVGEVEGKEDRETREVDNVSMLSGSLDNNIYIYI